jgi:oligopeptidase A
MTNSISKPINNPLLEKQSLPDFKQIKTEHILPAIEAILSESKQAIDSLLDSNSAYTWENFIEPMEKIDQRLSEAWSPVGHMHSVIDSDELRLAYDACLPLLSEYSTEMGQNRKLFKAFESIHDNCLQDLDSVQQKIIIDSLRDFKLAGVALEGEAKKRYGEIRKRLSEISSNYEKNILDATMAWHKTFADKTSLKGLPDSALAQAQQSAKIRQQQGYMITLEFPSYLAVITYAEDRKLREEIYTAFSTRASDQGPNAGEFDNGEIMDELLSLKHELANLLDFNNYAELSLATKMAQQPQQVFNFLNDLASRSKQQAETEFAELKKFAKKLDGITDFQPWDASYYSEKLREQKYAFNEEELRPYFPEQQVIKGMFAITTELYGVSFKQRNDVSCWHDDVRYFDVLDASGNIQAGFYLDLYARQHKRGGAWMDDCRNRMCLSDGSKEIAVAYLTCNFNSPVGDAPALFTHDEVVTLFHEFGHGLHHMLTEIDYPQVSGISGVPWDAVELPSQFNENFCYHPETLNLISGHYQTGEPLPSTMVDKILAARNFQSAMMMLRQIEFSLFDFHLHHDFDANNGLSVQQTLDKIRQQIAVLIPPAFNRFQNGFSHIFSGGYSAGYYSYKWAEVLSSDAFSRFEDEGILNSATGRDFLEQVLAKGGSEEPMALFKAFRGREPSIEPLLKHSGIQAA